MSKLLLIDGHAIVHRAYHALPPLVNSQNKPTGAIYGFLSILIRTIQNQKPTHLIVAFDRKEPTFRKKLLKSYQAQRPVMEESMIVQIENLHEILRRMGITIFEVAGFEADDVIGTLARQAEKTEVVIVTGDRDILQLVDDKIKVLMPVKGISESRLYGKAEVIERMGVAPMEITDLKALVGDPSDNYFGVSGIGPKTAITLIRKYQTLENIYKNIKDFKGKLEEKLKTGEESARLSKTLATIVCNVPVKIEWEKAKLLNFDRPDIRGLLEEWELRSLIPRLGGERIKPASAKATAGKKVSTGKEEVKKTNAEQTSLF